MDNDVSLIPLVLSHTNSCLSRVYFSFIFWDLTEWIKLVILKLPIKHLCLKNATIEKRTIGSTPNR